MSLRTEQGLCQGLVGDVQYTLDHPAEEPRGWALILHPHPLHGGTRDNKIVTTVGRACVQNSLLTIRPNFRGVGASAGEFDNGVGETADMLACVEHVLSSQTELADKPWVLAGFSFGSSVAAQLRAGLADRGLPLPARMMLIGSAVERFRHRAISVPADTVLVHGEVDDVVPLAECMEFAREHELPVTIVPDAGHFFHGKLLILRQLVQAWLNGL